jgi:HEPN domain-containing protein
MENLQAQIEYWRVSSERDWQTAEGLFQLGRYDSCLFFCHLAIEKGLKSLIVQETEEEAPYAHDLAYLAGKTGLRVDEQDLELLRTVSSFNIAARYDDDKFTFYKRCTKEYTQEYLEKSRTFFLWLQKQYRSM